MVERRSGSFRTTRWSLVRAVGGLDAAAAREALEVLCASYWYPLYAFARRSGFEAEESRDLTQGFFAMLLERGDFFRAQQDRGRFRSFLLTAMKHFFVNERERARALKRGGGRATVSIDFEDADERYQLDPGHDLTPERLFDRSWARAVIQRAMDRLGEEYRDRGQGELFDRLRPSLAGEPGVARQSTLARELGLETGALKVALHRLRRRFGERLREEVAETLLEGDALEDELRDLLAIFGS